MNVRVGFIPYLNMVPFHQGFGPKPMEARDRRFEFKTVSPRALGAEAEEGTIDAGPLSLVDLMRVQPHFQPVGAYGIGVKRQANSVLFFSNQPIASFSGVVAVTEETSTSFRLLQLLLETRYHLRGVRYGRMANGALFDGGADGMLLIGDEAIRARQEGVRGLHWMADLGEQWYDWQALPFVFARWAVRAALREEVKDIIETSIEKSLLATAFNKFELAAQQAEKRGFDPSLVAAYWDGFDYRLGPEHLESIRRFSDLLEKQCLNV